MQFTIKVTFSLTWRFLPFIKSFLIAKTENKLIADLDVDGSLLVEGDQLLGNFQAL